MQIQFYATPSAFSDFEESESKTQTSKSSDGNVAGENKKEWMKRLKKFGDDSSFSAAVYVFKSSSWIKKLFWVIVILLSIVGFITVTALSIRTLVEEPISTSITLTQEKSLEFPAVTVCTLTFLNGSRLDEFSRELGRRGVFLRFLLFRLFTSARTFPPDKEGCETLANELQSATNYSGGYGSIITDPFFGRNDPLKLVTQCTFLGEDCSNNLTSIPTVNGVCLRFNGPDTEQVRTINGIGFRQGLQIQLSQGDGFLAFSPNFGFNVIVHNRDEPPRPESEGTVVGLDSSLYISMRRINIIESTRFYSGVQCRRDTSFNEAKILFDIDTRSYSQSACLNDCFARQLADSCGCVERDIYTPIGSPYSEMPNCTLADLCCETIAFDQIRSGVCDCPLKCETVEHALSTSIATHGFSGMVGIHVYYDTLLLETRETTDSYTPWSLISDIGGNTGLFLGFTLLTVAEVVMLIVGVITDCCCPSAKGKMEDRKKKETKHDCIK